MANTSKQSKKGSAPKNAPRKQASGTEKGRAVQKGAAGEKRQAKKDVMQGFSESSAGKQQRRQDAAQRLTEKAWNVQADDVVIVPVDDAHVADQQREHRARRSAHRAIQPRQDDGYAHIQRRDRDQHH